MSRYGEKKAEDGLNQEAMMKMTMTMNVDFPSCCFVRLWYVFCVPTVICSSSVFLGVWCLVFGVSYQFGVCKKKTEIDDFIQNCDVCRSVRAAGTDNVLLVLVPVHLLGPCPLQF